MITFPNCKINLGLNIIRKRDDGYHALETIFYPLPIYDVLEVINNSQSQIANQQSKIEFTATGLPIEADEQNNLCTKAYHLLKKSLPSLPPVKIHLHKTIPIGAGFGGGSADGAFMLNLLNEKFHLSLSTTQLLNYAAELGSDCPFFIINQSCFAQGRGEMLEEINVDLSSYKFLIIHPNIHINTGWAFSKIIPSRPNKSIKQIIHQSIATWKDELKNDFELAVMEHYPELANIKQQLYGIGALYASMSGSGSAFYGIFDSSQVIPQNIFPGNYFVKEISSEQNHIRNIET